MKAMTVASVRVQAKATEALRLQLMQRAAAAGVPWHEAEQIVAGILGDTLRVAAHAQLVDMAGWTEDRWRSERNRFV